MGMTSVKRIRPLFCTGSLPTIALPSRSRSGDDAKTEILYRPMDRGVCATMGQPAATPITSDPTINTWT